MKESEAIRVYEENAYDIAKCVRTLNDIKDRLAYVNEQMNWDGMFMMDFSEAIEKLAVVLGSAVEYTLEGKFRDREIKVAEDRAKCLRGDCDD